MKLGKRYLWLILVVILLVGVVAAVVILPHYEGSDPVITLAKDPTHLGVSQKLDFQVSEQGKGLSLVKVTIEQPGVSKPILEKEFPIQSIWKEGGAKNASFSLNIVPRQLGLSDGPATLTIMARDHSWRRAFHGNVATRAFKVLVDTQPPSIQVLNRTIYLNRGGAGLAVYTVSKDASSHGVVVGKRKFRGFSPWPKQPRAGLCYFAFPEDVPRDTAISIFAEDPAGNRTQAPLAVRLKWKAFRHDIMRVSDNFLNRIVPRFAGKMPDTPKDALERYIYLNTVMRKDNNQAIHKFATETGPYQLWNEKAFLRPLGKLMAGFGDRRKYVYQQKRVISHSIHLGQDIASTKQAAIKATASGVVRYAGDMGIYGLCVILDHGQNVASLYGHLSTISVAVGAKVKAGQTIAQSGETGLAGGDHLHFSILVGGVFVQPREWWDPHWIQDNINLHLASAGLGLPAPPK